MTEFNELLEDNPVPWREDMLSEDYAEIVDANGRLILRCLPHNLASSIVAAVNEKAERATRWDRNWSDIDKVWYDLETSHPALRCPRCGAGGGITIESTGQFTCSCSVGYIAPSEAILITKQELADAIDAADPQGGKGDQDV